MNLSEASARTWWKPWYWPVGVWALVVGAFVFLLPFGIRTVILSAVPSIQQPYDEAEFLKWDVAPAVDAFTEYRQASDLLEQRLVEYKFSDRRDPDSVTTVLEKGWSAADEPLIQWIKMHREALEVWHRGTEKQEGRNMSPAEIRADTAIKVVQDQRLFVRLAMLEEARCLATGETDQAWQWARAAQRCDGHVTRRGSVIQGFVGCAIQNLSSRGLVQWAEQPKVTSDELMNGLQATRNDYRLYESRSNILKAEYRMLENSFSRPDWQGMLVPLMRAYGQESPGISRLKRMGYWSVGEPELTVRIFRQMLANQVLEIDKPVALRRKTVGPGAAMLFDPDPAIPMRSGQLDPAGINQGISRSFLYRTIAPSVKTFDSAMLNQEARQTALEVVLAVQAWQRDQGEYPASVLSLVPRYLDAVPNDPCDPQGGPLRYRRIDNRHAVVWSVGDDGNNGGGEVDSPNPNARPADIGFVIKLAGDEQ